MAVEISDVLNKYDIPEKKIKKIDEFISVSLPEFIEQLKLLEKKSSPDKYEQGIQSQLNRVIAKILDQAWETENFVNHELALKSLKMFFREKVGFSAYQSKLVRIAFEKPRGYPGDYELLENIYNNKIISSGFGRYWDRYFLDDDLATAVRDRKDMTVQYIGKYLDKTNKKKVKILNLACGSSRDLNELFGKLDKKKEEMLEVICFDQDEAALEYSKKSLSNHNVNVSYVKGNILNISKGEYQDLFAGQDIIYSIGLTDYLPDRVLKRFLLSCHDLLSDKGELFISHKDHMVYVPTVQDWFCDWTFSPRTEEDVKQIIWSFIERDRPLHPFRGINNAIYYFIVVKSLGRN